MYNLTEKIIKNGSVINAAESNFSVDIRQLRTFNSFSCQQSPVRACEQMVMMVLSIRGYTVHSSTFDLQ